MRQIVFILMIFCILATAESAHMIKKNEHKGRQDYPDNRRAGYEFLGWGMYGSGAMRFGIAPGMTGYDGCGMMGYGGPGMMGFGMGPGMWGYDAHRFDTYLNDTVDLRRELNIRQFAPGRVVFADALDDGSHENVMHQVETGIAAYYEFFGPHFQVIGE